eukprot:767089-Hanusia_phi.AAC.4
MRLLQQEVKRMERGGSEHQHRTILTRFNSERERRIPRCSLTATQNISVEEYRTAFEGRFKVPRTPPHA